MKKCVIISDSFKGTLSTFQIMDLFESECKKVFKDCKVVKIPVADGGEGTVDCFASILKGKKITVDTVDANKNKIKATYFLSEDNVAIIEVASVVGLPSTKEKNPSKTTTVGIAKLILDAIANNANKIIIGLGGSSTNDLGTGIAYGLGTKFYDKDDNEIFPVGGNLDKIERIDFSKTYQLLKEIEIVGMSDVVNPLTGINGASFVYAKQKGADEKMIEELDKNMKHLSNLLNKVYGLDIDSVPGSGAAGGIGGGILAFLNGSLQKGINLVLDTIKFKDIIKDADVIFTGEGKFDEQTKNGKVINGICEASNKPVVAIVGAATLNSEVNIVDPLKSVITTTRMVVDKELLKENAVEFYKATVRNVLRIIKLGEEIKKE